jgi:hypothetical protein
MLRDKAVFGADADTFRPERFLESELRDPRSVIFGFGRRWAEHSSFCLLEYSLSSDLSFINCSICPGRYMVQNSLFIAIASILQAFTISRAGDSSGNAFPLEEKWVIGLATYVLAETLQLERFILMFPARRLEPFACSITPRVDDLEVLIKANEG